MAERDTGFGASGDGKFVLLTGPGSRLGQNLDEAAKRAEQKFAKAIRLVVMAKPGGRHDPIGTCILADLDGDPYLFTATHVLDHNARSSLYVGGACGKWLLIEADFVVMREIDDNDPVDRMDISVAKLTDEFAALLGRHDFITKSDVSRSVASAKGRAFTFLGYPISQNKGYDPNSFTVKAKLRNYTSMGIDEGATYRQAGIHPDQHIAVSYSKFSKSDGQKAFSIDMHGFSGGAIIDVGEQGNIEVAGGLTVPDSKLIAIIIEMDNKQDIIFGTKIFNLLDRIVEHANQIDRP